MMLTPKACSLRGTLLRLGGSSAVLALLFHFLPLDKLWAALGRVPPGLWLAVLGGYLCAHVIGVLKWRLMINLAGAELSFAGAARCYFAGLFGTLFLPSIIGGDVLRIGLAWRLARSRAGAVLGSMADRVVDVMALLGVAAVGAFLLPGTLDLARRRVFWAVIAGAVAVAVVMAIVSLVLARRFSYRMRRRMVRLRQASRSMSRQPERVLVALALGLVLQTSFVLLTAVVAGGCGLSVPLRVWLFAWPLAKLSALLPITQGGIGVREAALAALAAPFGAAPVLTVAVGLVWEAIIIAGGLLAGLTSLLLGRYAPVAPVGVSSAPAPK